MPKIFYDYVEGGSWSEATSRANTHDLMRLLLRQRGVPQCRLDHDRHHHSRPSGQPADGAGAPTGLAGMVRADGEILAARAAAAYGVPFTLSTVSICSIEDIAERVAEPFWFQLYMMKDRAFIVRLIERARAAKCSALVLTVDLPIQGLRQRDVKNGLSVPPRLTPRSLAALISRPRWCAQILGTPRRTFGNIVGHAEGVTDTLAFAEWVKNQFDQTVTWDDVRWVKRQWGGKLVVKGIMDAADARLAVEAGADAIVVSNHGGRQLDGAPSSISALPAIVAAVSGQTEVMMDGGIRSGQDVLRALALGAGSVMIGRAFLYGLGALGEAGVSRCLDIIRQELEATMALCGVTDVAAIGPETIVNFPTDPAPAGARLVDVLR